MSTVNISLVSSAVVALLESAISPTPVGDGTTPEGLDELTQTERLQAGYLTVWQIPSGGRYEGSSISGEDSSDEWVRYQLTAVGRQRDQVEEIAHKAADALVARGLGGAWVHTLTVPSHSVIARRKAGGTPTDQDGAWNAGQTIDLLVSAE